MASPHVAGVAALTARHIPTWTVEDIKAAIVNTGRPGRGGRLSHEPRWNRAGPAAESTTTQVVARASGDQFAVSVNFGYSELLADYSQTREITLKNYGASVASFTVAQAGAAGSGHTLGLNSSSVSVPAGGTATLNVTLNVPVAGVAGSTTGGLAFREVAGLVTFTPTVGEQRRHAPRAVLPGPQAPVEGGCGARKHGDPGEHCIDDRHLGDRHESRRRPAGRGRLLRLGSRRRQRGRQRHERRAGGRRPVLRGRRCLAQRPRCRANASSCSL